MRRLAAAVALAGALLAGCNRQNPYVDSKSNPQGTPADRTGGARDVPAFEPLHPERKPLPPQKK